MARGDLGVGAAGRPLGLQGPATDPQRRRLLLQAAALIAAPTSPAAAPGATEGRASTLGVDPRLLPLRRVRAGVLDVAYADVGPSGGPVVLLLHGWPYDIHTYADVAPILAASGYRVLAPYLRGFGPTRFLSSATPRNGQQAALATDAIDFLDALGVTRAIVGGCDWGARSAAVLAALWPDRCQALVAVSGYLIGSREAGRRPLAAPVERQWWYQYYFATERGARGYARDVDGFARLVWETASPQWAFDDATFARSAAALRNPDHVAITIHNYRWRLGLAPGEPRFDGLERRLAAFPSIPAPTITLEGDGNGAPHPDPSAYADKFVGPYAHRTLTGGIGHNLPQEAPAAFARAIQDVDGMARG